MWSMPKCNLTGAFAVVSLSVFIFLAGLIAIGVNIKSHETQGCRSFRDPILWQFICYLLIGGTAIFTDCFTTLGLLNEVGLRSGPEPMLSPLAQGLMLSLAVMAIAVLGIILSWRDMKFSKIVNLWQMTLFMMGIYLVFVLLMAYFRGQLANQILTQIG
jgi:hypothetical protein